VNRQYELIIDNHTRTIARLNNEIKSRDLKIGRLKNACVLALESCECIDGECKVCKAIRIALQER
jgi:hypothetical protein